jgi:hypothetical protein
MWKALIQPCCVLDWPGIEANFTLPGACNLPKRET